MSTVRVIQNKQRLTKEGNAPLYITFYLGKEKLMLLWGTERNVY